MDQPPKFQGTLEKQGRVKTWSWKKYWFVLKDAQLSYVKNQDKVASQGHIDICQAHSVRAVSGNHGFQFEIVSKSRTHYLSASTADVREKWLRMLHEAMSWARRNASRCGSINSTRASCNSIIDEDDESGYSMVTSPGGSSSPTASSGYSSTSSNRESGSRISTEVPGGGQRDSGTDDTMVYNSNYDMFKGKGQGQSNADRFARDSAKSVTTPDGSVSLQSSEYEDIDGPTKHKGLRRLTQMKLPTDGKALPTSLTSRVSTQSDVSDIYDEVSEPVVNIAISHIVKGYANIARNKGPQPDNKPQSQISDAGNEEIYDEVFDSMCQPRESKVVMRRSQQRVSDDLDDVYDETSRESLPMGEEGLRDSLPTYAEANRPMCPRPRSKPSTSGLPVSPKPPASPNIRMSMLPSDVMEYFSYSPIPDLPHPRIELTYRSAFDDIRLFLANNRGPSEIYSAVKKSKKDGEAIRKLQGFLAVSATA